MGRGGVDVEAKADAVTMVATTIVAAAEMSLTVAAGGGEVGGSTMMVMLVKLGFASSKYNQPFLILYSGS